MAYKLVYQAEIIFKGEEPDNEFIEKIEQLAAAKDIRIEITDDHYRGDPRPKRENDMDVQQQPNNKAAIKQLLDGGRFI